MIQHLNARLSGGLKNAWLLLFFLLGFSFWLSTAWLQLCAGLALFLFAMQSLNNGVRQLAGGRLQALLATSTATPRRSFLFGFLATTTVQSSTLVSLLTMAFLSSGLITLAAGLPVLLGANLGSATGIWLLALLGQSSSLSTLALPLLVFAVLLNFSPQRQAVAQVMLGVAFLFLGIDGMKTGFSGFQLGLDTLTQNHGDARLWFAAAGFLLTAVLQSSHATLILALTAVDSGQLALHQAFALAIGANLGSTLTAVLAAIRSNAAGRRLAAAHVLFNLVMVTLALLLFSGLTQIVYALAVPLLANHNPPIQLAMFHTLCNLMGLALFWPWQKPFAALLTRWLPDREASALPPEPEKTTVRARYLGDSALSSADTALIAVQQELHHLEQLSLEVLCHALRLPVSQLYSETIDDRQLQIGDSPLSLDADALYRRHVKGVYSDLIGFMSRMNHDMTPEQQRLWEHSQQVAYRLVAAVKHAKHLQKNLVQQLHAPPSTTRKLYVDLRYQLLLQLRALHQAGLLPVEARQSALQPIRQDSAAQAQHFRNRLFNALRHGDLDSEQASSLINDLGYATQIVHSLAAVLDSESREDPAH